MRMIKSLAAFTVVAALAACGQEPQSAQAPEASAAAEAPVALGTFAGVLPCADCPGIETRLTLTPKGPDQGEGTYELVETYQERGEPIVTIGEWVTLRGSAADPDATVYQIDPGKETTTRYFRKDGENALRMLDRELGETPENMPYTLTRVE